EMLDGIVLPGGMPGTTTLGESEIVQKVIRDFAAAGKLVAAICAAPSVLGQAGILEGKKATCYPGFEDQLAGATSLAEPVVVDGNIITGRGMGTAIPFALAIIAYFLGEEKAREIGTGIIYY
ncbi:MAG: DJ-1/PfpI family protein, partial [Agathobacter sp.]|nr:DJ-1/PfpI family protein [Agathobacter sp.]